MLVSLATIEPVPWFVRGHMMEAMALSDTLRKNILFIGTREGEKFRPRATAFLCSWEDHGLVFQHLVTAEHVISGLNSKGWDIWGSVNMQNGDVAEFKLPYENFCFHPDETRKTDIAVCMVSDVMTAHDTGEKVNMDSRHIPLNGPRSMALTPEIAKDLQIGICDEIAIVGLFRNHYGKDRNIPIVAWVTLHVCERSRS